MDTIFALSTALGKAGVAVVRVSGPLSWSVVERFAGRISDPRVLCVRRLKRLDGADLDQAMVVVFEAGASFTGERCAEFHLHGSVAVVRALLADLADLEGCRIAEPGEFTRRALENDRMDLTQVEALSDLIEAETEVQRVQALDLLAGRLRDTVAAWREDLIQAASLIEVTIDFADEDVPVDVSEDVAVLLARVSASIETELEGLSAAERVRTGFEVAIVGVPNAGKSTLLNCLAGRDAAITSDVAGTTRDVIEVRMDIEGLPVTILDTAGLRETTDPVERQGVERARMRAAGADLRVHLVDAGRLPGLAVGEDDIVLVAKDDGGLSENGISGISGHGVSTLLSKIGDVLSDRVSGASQVSRERHRVALRSGFECLARAEANLGRGPDVYELVGEDIRGAIRALESLVGHVGVEAVLDRIFSSFCLGK